MAAKSEALVSVVGINALARDLKKLGDDAGPLLKELRLAHRAAAEPILTATRAAWPSVSGAHRDSVRITATRTGATIHEGNAKSATSSDDPAPGTGWLEFGGPRTRPHLSTRANVGADGRYLYPAARRLTSTVAKLDAAAIQKVLDAAATWTNTTALGTQVTE